MAKALDNDHRRAVERFLYGPMAGPVSQSPGTTRTRTGAENRDDGLRDNRARRMTPEVAELPIPIREDSTRCVWSVIDAARLSGLGARR